MKILIFYASYGGGHLSAAKSIESCIHKYYPNEETKLVDCMKYVNKPIEKITTAAYRGMAKKAPWAWGRMYNDAQKGPLAHISSRSNKIFAVKLIQLLRKETPDLIISTHPFSSQMCAYLKRKGKITARIATIMTDFAPHDQWLIGHEHTDYFFVAHDKMKKYLEEKGIAPEKIFATGIPVSSRFSKQYDKNEILNNFGLKPNKLTILFFAGGEFGLGKSQTLDVFNCIVNNFKDIQMIAIAGKNEKMKKHFENLVNEAHKQESIKILPFTNMVPELMSISNLVVTKPGGLTVTECLASHLPIVVISPIPGQEEENAEFLESKGIAVWIKKKDDPYVALSNLLSDENKLHDMQENTYSLANSSSTKDICSVLLSV